MFGALFKKVFQRSSLPGARINDLDYLTVRILADVDDVDPTEEEIEDPSNSTQTTESYPSLEFVMEEFLPRIAVHLSLDRGEGMIQWLTEDNVSSWGLPTGELFKIAFGNLSKRHVPNIQMQELTRGDSVAWRPLCEDCTVSSLIFADEMWKKFAISKDDVVAMIADRDTLIFCRKDSASSIKLLEDYRDLIWSDPDTIKKYRITRDLLESDADAPYGWAPYKKIEHRTFGDFIDHRSHDGSQVSHEP
jgi:hypothetical protein